MVQAFQDRLGMLVRAVCVCDGLPASDLHYREGLAMKRLLVLVVVLAPWSYFIAGCGGTGGSPGADSGKPTETQKQDMQAKMQAKMKTGKMQEMPVQRGPGGSPR